MRSASLGSYLTFPLLLIKISTRRSLTHGRSWPIGPWKWPEVCIASGLWRATMGFDRRATRREFLGGGVGLRKGPPPSTMDEELEEVLK